MRNSVGAVLVAVGLLAGGCGGGDKSPEEKCEDLISMVCDRIVECIDGASGMHQVCVQELAKELPCSDVKSVGATYDGCLDQLESISCTTLFPPSDEALIALPGACNSVLQSAPAEDPAIGRATSFSDAVHTMTSAVR